MLTAGAQGPTTIKVYEMLRRTRGLDDVGETNKDETQQFQITLGVIQFRYAGNMAKATGGA